MRKKLLMKSLLVAAALCVGGNAWADETANLTPTADTYFSWNNADVSYGTAETLYCGIWQEMWTNATPGLKGSTSNIAVFKFDVSAYTGKITGATFKVTATNPSTNSNTRSIYLGYFESTSWTEESKANNSGMVTRATSGLNIQPFGLSQSIAKGATKEVSFSSDAFLSYLNNDEDGIVSLIIYSLGQECTVNSKEADSGTPSLVLTYSNETLYTATFTETNSLEPTISIFSDEERTAAVSNGTLTNGTTYYYTASLAGYMDYKGSFTVSGANPTINFTMTAKTRYTFTVNAVDASSNVIKAIYTDADSYEGKTHTIVYPKYLTGTGNIVTYTKDEATYGESKTAQAKNETFTVNYTAYEGVAYFVEVEDVVSATGYGSWNCSNGAAVRGFTEAKDIFTVPAAGVYEITYAACNNNVNYDLAITLSKNDTEIATKSDFKSVSINYIKTTGIASVANVSLAAGDKLQLTPSSSNGIVDYMLVELKESVSPTIGSTGYATYASDYALDFSAANGVKAYKATAAADGKVTMAQVTGTAAAGEGLFLQKTEGEISIPVVASGDALTGNLLVRGTGAEEAKEDGFNKYVLGAEDESVAFFLINATAATVAKDKAYLKVPAGAGSRLAIVFEDSEATGIATVENANVLNENYYNLNGQRIVAPQKGLYIVNGKKVVMK